MRTTDISVLLPVKNGASTVRAAIASTLAGISPKSEILVFDDGSTDETAAILHRIRDERVKYHRADAVSGVAASLNFLLDKALHPLVARMDADDVAMPWRFDRQLLALSRDGSRVSFGNVVHFGERMLPRPAAPKRLSVGLMPRALLISNPVAHSTMLGMKDVVLQAGGYRMVPAEDYDLWLRLAARDVPMSRTAGPVILYRHHAEQVTRSTKWMRARDQDPALVESRQRLANVCAPRWSDSGRRHSDILNAPTSRVARRRLLAEVFGPMRPPEMNYLESRLRKESERLNSIKDQ